MPTNGSVSKGKLNRDWLYKPGALGELTSRLLNHAPQQREDSLLGIPQPTQALTNLHHPHLLKQQFLPAQLGLHLQADGSK